MNFCPFCGEKFTDKDVYVDDIAPDKESIEELYKNKKYKDILDMALAGNILAMYNYIQFITKIAVKNEMTYNKEIERVEKLSNENIVFAKSAYGMFLYYKALDRKLWSNNGYNLIVEAYNSGDIVAKYMMSVWKQIGNGLIEKDTFGAYKLLKQTADAGYPSAIYSIGYMHYRGDNVSEDKELGMDLIEKAAFLGEEQANLFMSKVNIMWRDDNFGYWLNPKEIKTIVNIIKNESDNDFNSEEFIVCDETTYEKHDGEIVIDAKDKLLKCKNIDDYVELFDSIKNDTQNNDTQNDEEKSILMKWLSKTISSFTSIPIDIESVSKTKEIMRDKERAILLAKRYTCPQHFLHFKNDLKRLEINMEPNEVQCVMLEVSDLISEKFKKEINLYEAYSKAKKNKKEAKGGCLPTVVWTIFAFIGIAIFPIVGIVIGILAFVCWIGTIYKFLTSGYTMAQLKGYTLINELIGYGYNITNLKGEKLEIYDESQRYDNKISSILD
jgi:hypothetical protein